MADPTIALQVQAPQIQQQQINPFSAAVDMMRVQQMSNENKMWNLKLQANQYIGNIMSQYDNPDEALDVISRSPAAPYAADYIKTFREAQQVLAQTHKAQEETGQVGMKINEGGLSGFVKQLGPLAGAIQRDAPDDEIQSIIKGASDSVLATVPANHQGNVAKAMNGVLTSIFANAPASDPNNPQIRRSYLMNKMANLFASNGMTGEDIKNIVGNPDKIDAGNGWYLGVRLPDGTFLPSYDAGGKQVFIPKQIEPKVYPAGGIPYGGPTEGGTPPGIPQPLGYPGAPGQPNTLSPPGAPQQGPTPAPAPQGPVPAPTGPQARSGSSTPTRLTTPGTTGAQPDVISPTAGDDKPLWDDSVQWGMTPQVMQKDVAGAYYLTPGEQKRADDALTTYNSAGAREFESANRAMGQLAFIDNSLDHLANTVMQPGAYGERRVEAANTWNTAMDVLSQVGLDTSGFKVNARNVAEGEALIKSSRLLQFSTVTQAFGAQREAAQTIMAAARAVPGMNNTLLGNKLLVETLRSAAQREIDLRNFQTQWLNDPRSRGDLTGSETAFNKMHPAQAYAQSVLNKFGLSKDGFTDLSKLETAAQNHWIDAKTAQAAYADMQKRGLISPGAGAPTGGGE